MAQSKAPTLKALRAYEEARAAGVSVEDAASLLVPAPRPKRVRETDEYLRDLTRMVKRAGVRTADADGPELVQLLELITVVEEAAVVAVKGQRDRGSWQFIADGLGVSRQAAQQRFGKRVAALEAQAETQPA